MLVVVSGGHFRATRHRVAQPPDSQSTFERLSLVCFNGSKGDLRMQPCWGESTELRSLQ
jgi:isopenicillin N synthase-like dioxygenase